jgi:hypothetical protein
MTSALAAAAAAACGVIVRASLAPSLAAAISPRPSVFPVARVFVTTTSQTLLFDEQPCVQLYPLPPQPRAAPTVRIDSSISYQEMTGFGAAITDAAAHVLMSAPDDLSDHLLRTLFAPFTLPSSTFADTNSTESCTDADLQCAAAIADGSLDCATDWSAGRCNRSCAFCTAAPPPAEDFNYSIGLSVVRVPMGVSDFSLSYALGNITYADTPDDWSLNHFSTAHDDSYILPLLRKAKALNPQLKVIASPWTAPLWLKDPPGSAPDQIGGGTLLNTTQAYDTCVHYYTWRWGGGGGDPGWVWCARRPCSARTH